MRETAACICGSKNGSLRELSRGRRKSSTSFAQRNPFRESSRAMHSDRQISVHAIALPFNSSRAAKIQRLCRLNVVAGWAAVALASTGHGRVKLAADSSAVNLTSTRLCTDQFIRGELSDKTQRITCVLLIIPLAPHSKGTSCEVVEMPIRFRGSFQNAQASSRRFLRTCAIVCDATSRK